MKLANNPEAVEAVAEWLFEQADPRKSWQALPEGAQQSWREHARQLLSLPIFTAAIAEARDEGLEEAAREFDEYAKLARYYEQQAIDAGRTDEAAQHQTDAVDNEVAAIEIRALKGKP